MDDPVPILSVDGNDPIPILSVDGNYPIPILDRDHSIYFCPPVGLSQSPKTYAIFILGLYLQIAAILRLL